MKFEKWLEDFNEAFGKTLISDSEHRPDGLRIEENVVIVPKGLEEKALQLYTAYKIEKTNKRLVWATWALAIGTLLLTGITLYFQYFK